MVVRIRTLAEQDLHVLTPVNTTGAQTVQLGAAGVAADGRRYRYVTFGGTSTIAPGRVVTVPATTANYQGLVITAVGTSGQVTANLSAGSYTLVLTNGATAVTQDQFAEGYLELLVGSAGASGSYSLKIKGNTAAAASGAITVFLYEPLFNTTALVPGTDTANLNTSIYSGVNTSTTAAIVAGVTVVPVPNTASVSYAGWVQTHGPALVLNDAGGTITVGGGFAQSVSVAGSVVASSASAAPIIGTTRKAITASTTGPVYLRVE